MLLLAYLRAETSKSGYVVTGILQRAETSKSAYIVTGILQKAEKALNVSTSSLTH